MVLQSLDYYLSPRQRLDTLFFVHSTFSIGIGLIGYIFPSTLGLLFLTENDREYSVGRAIYRPLCALLLAQGLIVYRSRKINDGRIKHAFVQAFFILFFMATISLINEHYTNSGVVSGKFWGTIQVISMIGLTSGYAWFIFMQPPSVFRGLATHHDN